ncbi:antirestriction protein ArdA [Pararhizobium sp. IMCC21322]|uniref:antirestriction protein ArdA n=1 Tax=Pararhizobium sp. IMCC21322 TaxID=3067903 RepID=UPI0027423BAC|nr:antirestriction protein ArdA [Pararhizobium sp. IMCC21322]
MDARREQGFMFGVDRRKSENLVFENQQCEDKMTLIFYAQPYDISAEGFYFRSVDEYERQASILRNSHGQKVEEFEIQFIDGETIDCELAKVWGLNQTVIEPFIEAVDDWNTDQKIRFIIAVGECGYSHSQLSDDPEDIEIDIYELDSLKELAYQFVEEGLFGDIPERLQHYLNYDAIARDLGADYSETTINSTNFVYRCA